MSKKGKKIIPLSSYQIQKINRKMETLRKNHMEILETKFIMIAMKISQDRINSKFESMEERNGELDYRQLSSYPFWRTKK